ncbi:hypothetical protein [Viscerimonas tarda]
MKKIYMFFVALFFVAMGVAGCGDDEKNTPKSVEIQDLSLERVSYFCWENIELNKIYLINSEQELNRYFSCRGDDIPAIDVNFDDYSLIIAHGVATGGIGIIKKEVVQMGHNKYNLNIDITLNLTDVAGENWQVASLIPKLPQEQNTVFSLNINQHY